MSETLSIYASPPPGGEVPRVSARLMGKVDGLSSRRGVYRLVFVGTVDDMEQLAAVARMQSADRVEIVIHEFD
jgi:hypothetical protein